MGRIMAIDYGTKKTGIAVSDPLRIIATGLDTLPTAELMPFLERYFATETVDILVFGMVTRADGTAGSNNPKIEELMRNIQKKYPSLILEMIDESYTSERAKAIILQSGIKKKKRQDKTLVDKVSAVLILQDFMERTDGLPSNF
jgi:putative holliday junction resolvase